MLLCKYKINSENQPIKINGMKSHDNCTLRLKANTLDRVNTADKDFIN